MDADSDGDGMSDGFEVVAGTGLSDSESVFRLRPMDWNQPVHLP